MRRLIYDLERKSLETIYKSFIRLLIEYANVIWDNCTQQNKKLTGTHTIRSCKNINRNNKISLSCKSLYRNWLGDARCKKDQTKTGTLLHNV